MQLHTNMCIQRMSITCTWVLHNQKATEWHKGSIEVWNVWVNTHIWVSNIAFTKIIMSVTVLLKPVYDCDSIVLIAMQETNISSTGYTSLHNIIHKFIALPMLVLCSRRPSVCQLPQLLMRIINACQVLTPRGCLEWNGGMEHWNGIL